MQILKNIKKETYTISESAIVLEKELAWLSEVIHTRIALYFEHETTLTSIQDVLPPELLNYNTPYVNFIKHERLSVEERLLLILALVPHLKPALLDILSTKNKEYDRRFSEFGGVFLDGYSSFIPTAQTALFILTGNNIAERLRYQPLVINKGTIIKKDIIQKQLSKSSTSDLNKVWKVAQEYVDYFLYGKPYEIGYSPDFPAQKIDTKQSWEDLVVAKSTGKKLQEIRDWITHGKTVLEDLGLEKRLKPGYKSLFYGAPGTGKTMTAALLGKSTGKQVYKIDLSMTVSKYIGETEKNLAKVFDQAEQHDWILFFDEADSLFGQRTQVNSANDRYGNQEIGYLLQRIEDFPGVVILASNLKDNIDDAFTRRFQSMIEFKVPDVEQRYQLWEQSFSERIPLATTIDLWKIAKQYQISGGVMMNVVRKCTLQAVAKQETEITQQSFVMAIQQEMQKEGIVLT
ncbi:ATP-binding protein [Tenacibaculum jejuense]|uniref:AAA ATPase central domain protein n=1 Tax=Tenacibaculum jejuense TaxID=584609 RepID=A0A238UET4_9FLAO|nr:ATP-binding protein [Tenacibaculum jejuense]SNR16920.1 AAA ATPase central domain protein [Tenacibaculum jejuense]